MRVESCMSWNQIPRKVWRRRFFTWTLCVAGVAVTEEAGSKLAKNGRIAGRKRAGGRWDSDKRDGGHRTPAVVEIRGRGSQQRPGHIIHKPTLSHPNSIPTGPAVTTNAPLPGGRSSPCGKIIWGFAGIFSEIGKFNFPLIPGDRRGYSVDGSIAGPHCTSSFNVVDNHQMSTTVFCEPGDTDWRWQSETDLLISPARCWATLRSDSLNSPWTSAAPPVFVSWKQELNVSALTIWCIN